MDSNKTGDPINLAITENKGVVCDWCCRELASEMYWFIYLFNAALFKSEPVSLPVISFKCARIDSLVHCVLGGECFAVKEKNNLNSKRLGLPSWMLLEELLHEMAYSWEQLYLEDKKRIKGWYRTVAFRKKLNSFGIHCNQEGQRIACSDPFVSLLKQHAVGVPVGSYIAEKPDAKGKSALKEWACACTSVRVG